jgi:hypothetical protein
MSKGTWKEGTGTGSKKEGRCANMVEVAFFSGMARFNF